jgi:hypothetical protein
MVIHAQVHQWLDSAVFVVFGWDTRLKKVVKFLFGLLDSGEPCQG